MHLHNLDTISLSRDIARYCIARLRRDCAAAAWSPTGPTECRSARSTPRGCWKWPGLFRFDKVVEYGGGVDAWVFEGFLRQLAHTRQNAPRCTHAPTTTVLGHFVESERTRPFPISPWHSLQAPLDGKASRWLGCGCAISAQSRGGRFPLDAGEIAPRSRACTQAIQRRFTVTEGAEHATEISTTPGMAGWRRSQREWQHLAQGVCTARRAPSRERAPKRLGTPMRQILPFSLTSPPHSHPGRCGYLRRVLCAVHQIVTPLDGLGVGARSRRNLALMRY